MQTPPLPGLHLIDDRSRGEQSLAWQVGSQSPCPLLLALKLRAFFRVLGLVVAILLVSAPHPTWSLAGLLTDSLLTRFLTSCCVISTSIDVALK